MFTNSFLFIFENWQHLQVLSDEEICINNRNGDIKNNIPNIGIICCIPLSLHSVISTIAQPITQLQQRNGNKFDSFKSVLVTNFKISHSKMHLE